MNKNLEDILYKIQSEGFDYWLTEYYRRLECEKAGVPKEILVRFDRALSDINVIENWFEKKMEELND